MKATIVTIGDELLFGQTIDTNSAWLGQQLTAIGIQIQERIAVGDDMEDILSALQRAHNNSSLILITGGLGPTKDDITKAALVSFMGSEMIFSQKTYDHITAYFAKKNRKPTPAHRRQSMMPSNAMLFENSIGTAPGMWMEYKGAYFLSMPGVPSEMKQIMLEHGLNKIKVYSSTDYILHSFIRTIGTGETIINQKIENIIADFPSELSLAFLPGVASVKLRITARGQNEKDLESKLEKYTQLIADRINESVYSFKDEEIQYTLYELCQNKGITIGTAESCTGGGIASRITEVPGSSSYFEGSIVSYSNQVKQSRLGVGSETLEKHGAVSEQTVVEMVNGAIKALNVDIAVAVSGIAGPGGGSPDKPVGTVWIAVGDSENVRTRKIQLNKNRILNIEATEKLALFEVRRFILDFHFS